MPKGKKLVPLRDAALYITKLPKALSTEQREKLCWRNAADLYGIDISVDLATG